MNTRSIKAQPAQSKVAEAAAEAVGAKTTGSNVVLIGGGGMAAGAALADDIWQASQTEGSKWAGYFVAILDLDTDGLRTFRSALTAKKQVLAEQEKATPGGPKTNFVRISEAMTVSKARFKGMTLQNVVDGWNSKGIGEPRTAKQMPHAWIVAYARKYVADKSGKTPSQRVELTPEQLLQRYILSHFTAKEMGKAFKVAQELRQKVRTEKQRTEMLTPPKAAKTANPPSPTPAQVAPNSQAKKDASKNLLGEILAKHGKPASRTHVA